MFAFVCLCAMSILRYSHTTCSSNKEVWVQRKNEFPCSSGKNYHCLRKENNHTTEICIPRKRVDVRETDGSKCPVLINGVIQFESCKHEGCPNSPYNTDELYQYSVCFGPLNVFDSNSASGSGENSTGESSSFLTYSSSNVPMTGLSKEDTSTLDAGKRSRYLFIFGGTGLAFVVILNVCVITFYCIRKRHQDHKKTSAHENQPVSIAVMSQIYDHTTISSNTEENNVCNIGENEDIYNHLQTRRVRLDQPILYDSD